MARVPASRSERYACTVSDAQPLQYRRLSVSPVPSEAVALALASLATAGASADSGL
jgi:hypothetical protein